MLAGNDQFFTHLHNIKEEKIIWCLPSSQENGGGGSTLGGSHVCMPAPGTKPVHSAWRCAFLSKTPP